MDIPRKLSVEEMKNDAALDHIGQRLEITLDGEHQDAVVRYDVDAGEIDRYAKDADGKFIVRGGEVIIETVKGAVGVSLKERA